VTAQAQAPRRTEESPADAATGHASVPATPEPPAEARWEPKWPGEGGHAQESPTPWTHSAEPEPAAVEAHPAEPETDPLPSAPEADWPPERPVPPPESTTGRAPQPEANLGPVEGPQPRPPDLPTSRTARRRDRADTTSIAELLAEALAAYQSTASDDEPTQPRVEPVRENTPPAQRPRTGTGRHRMPDWSTSDNTMTDWMTSERDSR
jgi:hypothetical protein